MDDVHAFFMKQRTENGRLWHFSSTFSFLFNEPTMPEGSDAPLLLYSQMFGRWSLLEPVQKSDVHVRVNNDGQVTG